MEAFLDGERVLSEAIKYNSGTTNVDQTTLKVGSVDSSKEAIWRYGQSVSCFLTFPFFKKTNLIIYFSVSLIDR